MAIILLKTNIPAFHHSIIPFSGKFGSPKTPLYSQQVVEIPRRPVIGWVRQCNGSYTSRKLHGEKTLPFAAGILPFLSDARSDSSRKY
jgi:hypothetical protein